jgi:hypothetical protein
MRLLSLADFFCTQMKRKKLEATTKDRKRRRVAAVDLTGEEEEEEKKTSSSSSSSSSLQQQEDVKLPYSASERRTYIKDLHQIFKSTIFIKEQKYDQVLRVLDEYLFYGMICMLYLSLY